MWRQICKMYFSPIKWVSMTCCFHFVVLVQLSHSSVSRIDFSNRKYVKFVYHYQKRNYNRIVCKTFFSISRLFTYKEAINKVYLKSLKNCKILGWKLNCMSNFHPRNKTVYNLQLWLIWLKKVTKSCSLKFLELYLWNIECWFFTLY